MTDIIMCPISKNSFLDEGMHPLTAQSHWDLEVAMSRPVSFPADSRVSQNSHASDPQKQARHVTAHL